MFVAIQLKLSGAIKHNEQRHGTAHYVVLWCVVCFPPTHYEYLNVIGTKATAVLHLEWASQRAGPP